MWDWPCGECVSVFPSRWASVHSSDNRCEAENWVFPYTLKFPRVPLVITVSILSCLLPLELYISVTENKACTSPVNTKQRQNCTLSECFPAWGLYCVLRACVSVKQCHDFKSLKLTRECRSGWFRSYRIEVSEECSLRWIKLPYGTR